MSEKDESNGNDASDAVLTTREVKLTRRALVCKIQKLQKECKTHVNKIK